MSDVLEKEWLTPEEAAELLSTSTETLAKWRSTGRYQLPFAKAGGIIRYSRKSIYRWLESRERTQLDPDD